MEDLRYNTRIDGRDGPTTDLLAPEATLESLTYIAVSGVLRSAPELRAQILVPVRVGATPEERCEALKASIPAAGLVIEDSTAYDCLSAT